jgi:AmmeMemoRadiSam system protein B
VVSPHIDFMRGGLTYARVWKRAAEAARAAELAIILGTDHFGRSGSITLTHQPYATPYGVLPQPPDASKALSDAIGHESSYAGELHHRTEHSVELSAVWMHHARNGQPIDTVPVLVGSFSEYIENGTNPVESGRVRRFVDALASVAGGRRTLLVASVDLSHVGPEFGGVPLDASARRRLRTADRDLIGRVCAGDAEGFLRTIQRSGDETNICGTGPIYMMMHALGATRGREVDYQLYPADDTDTSAVSVCGVLLE